MAQRNIGADLDLALQQILRARYENLATAPTHAVGRTYFDTVLGYARTSDGSNWQRTSFLADPFARANHTGTQVAATISDFNTAVRTNRLDQMAAPSASVDFGGQKAINVAAGSADSDGVNVGQLSAVSAGQTYKMAARLATAAPLPAHGRVGNVLTASANGALTVDGTAPIVGDRVLVLYEGGGSPPSGPGGTHSENGPYVVTATGSGAAPWVLTRSSDADTSAEFAPGMTVPVAEGTANHDSVWMLTTDAPIVLNTTALTFGPWPVPGVVAGAGLLKTGQIIDVVAGSAFATGGPGGGLVVAADSIAVDGDVVARWKGFTIGDNAATSFVINHALGHQWPLVQVAEAASGLAIIDTSVVFTDANNLTVAFNFIPTSNQYRVTVVG